MPNPPNSTNYGIPLMIFQIDNLSIKEKSDFAWGKQLAEYIQSLVNGGTSSYFWVRNQRWKINRMYANGRIDMQRFMDQLEFNGKQNYINLNWQCIKLANRICSGLVSRWMERDEKIDVTAIDTLSTTQKEEEYQNLEFYLDNLDKMKELEKQSGVKIVPDDIPADKEQLLLWRSELQRLPEEILYEEGINDVFSSNGWDDVLKEKILHDSVSTAFLATYTWMDAEGVIHVEWLKPENCFYSYSDYPDFRDTTWRGRMTTMKVSELRKKYSLEFNPNNSHGLTEQQLFDMAKTAKEYQQYDNITWLTECNVTYLRPYDEWNIDITEFELKTVDTESYTVVTTKGNGSTIVKKGKPKKKSDNEEVVDDSRINIYRGVYARSTQTMLEWGLKKNMIRPQDPKEIGNAEFSYSFYMIQNFDMTCLGIPEKIQEPLDQMIIARLKIQQLVMKMRPMGTAVNWTAVQNIDYGLGEGNKAIDFKKMFDQTGDIYYHDKDAEGNPIGVPFMEIPNAGFLPQLQGLILLYDKHYQILKDELGEDPNLITQAAQPRVAVQNIETSQQQADYATDQYYKGYSYVMNDTARKVSCLLKDSVKYGAKVYRRIVGQEDIENRVFTTQIQLLPDAIAMQRFENLMNQAIASNQDLILFLDPFQMMRIAKRDVKLGETFFRQAQKKMIIWQRQTAMENQQQTIQGQIQSAQAAEQSKQETENIKGDIDIQKVKIQEESASKTATLTLVTSLLSKGEPIPPYLQPLVNTVIENIMIPMVSENEEQKAAIRQQMQQAIQQQSQPPQQQNQQPVQQQDQNKQQPIAA